MLPRWLITFRAFALASAFAAAFVPIATYITDDKRDWLWIHIGVNIAAYIAVALTTIYTTVNLTQQDHNKFSVAAYWANNVIMRTWYLGVSKTWRWHVAAAVGRLGLALALAQHVHIVMLTGPIEYRNSQFQGILSQFQYVGFNALTYSPEQMTTFIQVHSQWETTLIGFAVLLGFAILETGLLTSWTLIACRITQGKNLSSILGTYFARLALVVFMIESMSFVQQSMYSEYHSPACNKVSFANECSGQFKEWHKKAFTWLDNGTMLATWIMRPMSHAGFNYACVEVEAGTAFRTDCLQYNNRLFVFTDFLTALMSYATYILAIIASLQLAQYLHWRREQRESPTPAPTTP